MHGKFLDLFRRGCLLLGGSIEENFILITDNG